MSDIVADTVCMVGCKNKPLVREASRLVAIITLSSRRRSCSR